LNTKNTSVVFIQRFVAAVHLLHINPHQIFTVMTKVAVAKGDGIGPEIMDAVLKIFDAAKVPLEY